MQLDLKGLPGQTVTGVDELKQMICLVLMTPAGSVPLRDDLDSKLYDYIDKPITHVTPLVIAETHRLLDNRIPGFNLQKVTVQQSNTGKLEIIIKGIYNEQEIKETLEINKEKKKWT